MKKMRISGVNLGGWLVLERWLTPWVFEDSKAEDECGLMASAGARERIEKHRQEYVTEADWQWLAKNGITQVRIPVGYWVLGGEAPYVGAEKYLDWAFNMAEKYNISVLLSIHGVKGSQNGEHHSGKAGAVDWWRHRHDSLRFLGRISRRYGTHPALWGIGIMNEPKGLRAYFQLIWYYRKAYAVIRQNVRRGVRTVYSDAYLGPLSAGALHARKGFPVVMDSHFYLLGDAHFSWLSLAAYDRLRRALYAVSIWVSSLWQPVIVGEWSAVLPRPMLNRVPKPEHLRMQRETIEHQVRMYRRASATFYWNYKANGPAMFNFKSLVDEETIEL